MASGEGSGCGVGGLVPYAVPYRKFDERELKRRICIIGEEIKGARIGGRMAAKPYGQRKSRPIWTAYGKWQGQKDSNPQQRLEGCDRYAVYDAFVPYGVPYGKKGIEAKKEARM